MLFRSIGYTNKQKYIFIIVKIPNSKENILKGYSNAAEEVFNNYEPLVKDKELQGAMVTLNSSNGHVISIIGGKHFQPGNFNRAVDAKRQVGSAFKPFVYLSAIIDGKSENTIVEDSRVVFGTWAPKNVGTLYRKNATLLEGLDKSVNMISIKLLRDLGHEKLLDTIKKTKTDLNPPNDLKIGRAHV